MKKLFLTNSLKCIKKKYKNISDIKLDEYRYFLECLYMTITKLIIILIIAIYLKILKEFIILIISFNFIRETARGLHATKTIICLILSILFFIGIPLISKLIIIPFTIKLLLNIIGILLIYKYAPADTKNAPIIKQEKRKKLKIISTFNAIILAIINIVIKNNIVSNIILFSIYLEIILILPLTYRIFKLPYNNYIDYIKNELNGPV